MKVLTRLFLAAVLASGVSAVQAQAFPGKLMHIVVPFPPGGSTDLMARRIADKLQASTGQPAIVENKPGAGGAVGAEYVARSAPDGYTVMMGVTGSHAISVSLNPKLPYDPLKDFVPITKIMSAPLIIAVTPKFPAKTLAEFVAYARARPDQVTHATPGNGTSMHLTGEMFNIAAGLKLVHVPFKGSAGALNGLLGDQVQVMFGDFLVLLPQIRAGRLNALAVTSATRHPLLPDVPTVAESGYPGFEALSWQGLFAPAGTPPEIVARLNAEVVKALAADDVRDSFAKQGMIVAGSTPAEFRAFVAAEITKWAKIIKTANVTLQ